MTTIRDRIASILDLSSGFDEGYAKGVEDTLAALADFVRERSERPHAQDTRAHRNGGSAGAVRLSRTRRGLTPSEQAALSYITAHPGCTGNDLRRDLKSAAPAYKLLRRRKIRRVEDPKPHLGDQPWVRFYPANYEEAPHDAQQL